MSDLFKRFCKDEDGVVAIELLLMTPILVWALLSTFVYFDAFRVDSVSNRAALTMADMFSREDEPITPEFLDGAESLLKVLTFEEAEPDFRVTVYTYNSTSDLYATLWSETRGYDKRLDTIALNKLKSRLPLMANGDRSILVETRVEYSAPIPIGIWFMSETNLKDIIFDTFTVIRPREDQLCWDSDSIDPINVIVC